MDDNNVIMIVYNEMKNDSRVHKEASELGKSGYKVCVLALHEKELPLFEQAEFYEIHRIKLISKEAFKSGKMLAVKLLELYFKTIWHIIKLSPVVIHAHDLQTLPPAALSAGILGVPLVYDSHELHTARSGDGPMARRVKFAVEHSMLPFVDMVLMSDGDSRIGHFREIHNYRKEIIDIGNFPLSKKIGVPPDLKADCGIDCQSLLMVYAGSLQRGRGLLSMLSFMIEHKDVYLVLLGASVDRAFVSEFTRRIDASGLKDRVFFKEAVPPEDVVGYLRSCDLGLCIIENTGLSYYYSRPTKMFEYVYAGIPFIASRFPEMCKVMNQYLPRTIGWSVDLENEAETVSIFNTIYEQHCIGSLHLNTELIRDVFLDYNWNKEGRKLVCLYEKLKKREYNE